MYYSETEKTDPYYNLAFEEYILREKTHGEWLLLWQNANAIVVGLNQNTLEEINPEFVSEHGIQVVRRTTGGGAVYHDLGNLNYSFIADAGQAAELSMAYFSNVICAALATMGVTAEVTGRNDITVHGKKISGTAQRMHQGRLLHHGTLLFSSDRAKIDGALRADPQKYSSGSTKSSRSRTGNICDYLPEEISIEVFKDDLRKTITESKFTQIWLTAGELDEVKRLADEKYRTWEWNYGASPPYTMKNETRFEGGRLAVLADIRKGKIESVRFYGDFLARMPLDPLIAALKGRRYDFDEVKSILEVFPIAEMFGAISRNDILDLMFS